MKYVCVLDGHNVRYFGGWGHDISKKKERGMEALEPIILLGEKKEREEKISERGKNLRSKKTMENNKKSSSSSFSRSWKYLEQGERMREMNKKRRCRNEWRE